MPLIFIIFVITFNRPYWSTESSKRIYISPLYWSLLIWDRIFPTNSSVHSIALGSIHGFLVKSNVTLCVNWSIQFSSIFRNIITSVCFHSHFRISWMSLESERQLIFLLILFPTQYCCPTKHCNILDSGYSIWWGPL